MLKGDRWLTPRDIFPERGQKPAGMSIVEKVKLFFGSKPKPKPKGR